MWRMKGRRVDVMERDWIWLTMFVGDILEKRHEFSFFCGGLTCRTEGYRVCTSCVVCCFFNQSFMKNAFLIIIIVGESRIRKRWGYLTID